MKIERPPAEKRKIHSKDEFELCYMRHQYLRRVTYNPTEKDMAPYMKIVKHYTKNTFYMYKNLFNLIGFDVEDMINIGRIHLTSFLGLYELGKSPKKYEEFLVAHWKKHDREALPNDVDGKNKANFTLFIKQRMEDVVRVCRQKARNIKGFPTEQFAIFYGPVKPPSDLKILLRNYDKYQFKKLDPATFKSIKKKMKIRDSYKPFQFAGYWYVAVPLDHRNLTMFDFTGAGLDPYDSIHNKNPEQLLFDRVREEEFELKKSRFKKYTKEKKQGIMLKFIAKNKNNPIYKEEVALAEKFLDKLGL